MHAAAGMRENFCKVGSNSAQPAAAAGWAQRGVAATAYDSLLRRSPR